MKLLDIDWAAFIERLAEWERISLKARKILAEMKPNQGREVREFGRDAPDLAAAGFLSYYSDGRRVRLYKECYPFARAIRAMVRNDVFRNPKKETLYRYLRENFTARERATICPNLHYYYADEEYVARRVTSVSWLDKFLAAENGDPWEKRPQSGEPLLSQPKIFEAVTKVVREFMTLAGPIAFRDLPGRFAALSPDVLGTAILAGIQHLFLFPAMRQEDMTPVLGLWPAITHRLHRPKAEWPKRVKPDQTYHCAFLMEDMTAIIVAITARPARIRVQDGALFAKAQKEIEANLLSIPDWLSGVKGVAPVKRVGTALRVMCNLGYVRAVGQPGKDLSLQATDQGAKWLAACAKTRLKAVLDLLRPNKSQYYIEGRTSTKEAFYDSPFGYESHYLPTSFDLIPYPVQIRGTHDQDVVVAVGNAFGTLGGIDFVLFKEFLHWHAEAANPLLQPSTGTLSPETSFARSAYPSTDEQMELLWWNLLEEFALTRLLPLGGLQIGILGEQRSLCISLTDAGRYLLGLAEDFDYGHEHESEGVVLIQPNFDVVFISPSPQAEASIGRFAERQGRSVGALFKITKKSIVTAASTGMTSDQVLDTLRGVAAKDVPANVQREIRGWFDQCRRVTVKRAILVHCPDAHTGARVLAAGGKKASAITDTVIELEDSNHDSALFRKLDNMGIFSVLPEPSAKKRRKKRARRRRW